MGWSAPAADAEFAAAMDDRIETSERPYDPAQPVQGVKDTRVPLAATTAPERRVDDKYERAVSVPALLFCELLGRLARGDLLHRAHACGPGARCGRPAGRPLR